MKLELGKYYITAYGKKVGPVRVADSVTSNEWALWKSENGCIYEVVGLPCEEAMDTKFLTEWADFDKFIYGASETTKTWSEMTPEEKGALLLAHHEGKVIEVRAQLADTWSVRENPNWCEGGIFRVRHEPVHETIVMFGEPGFAFSPDMQDGDTHRITFDLIDGKPDCDSIKMEEL